MAADTVVHTHHCASISCLIVDDDKQAAHREVGLLDRHPTVEQNGAGVTVENRPTLSGLALATSYVVTTDESGMTLYSKVPLVVG